MNRLCVALILALTSYHALAQTGRVNVLVTEVTDNRTTGQFFSGSEIKLSLTGDVLADIRGVRQIEIAKAVDDTGRNIVKKEQGRSSSPFSFAVTDRQHGPLQQSLKLANPARSASSIKEVNGTIELYAPAKDPKAVLTVKNFMSRTGKPLSLPELSKNKISLTIMTKEQAEAMKKEQQAQQEKAAKDSAPNLGKALGEAFGQMFFGLGQMGENDVSFIIKDPDNKLVDLQVQDAKGEPLKHNSRMSSGGTYTVSYNEKPGQNAQVVIYLATPASIIKVPLALRDIALP